MTKGNKDFIAFSDMVADLKISTWKIARLATFLPIAYNPRDGITSGSIACRTYGHKETPYPTKSFREGKVNKIPALDCSGFISWVFNIAGIYEGPMNEDAHRNIRTPPKGSGNWNIWAKCHYVITPHLGDLLFSPTHIMMITGLDDKNNIVEVSHSGVVGRDNGTQITTGSLLKRLLKESVKASKMVGKSGLCIGRYTGWGK